MIKYYLGSKSRLYIAQAIKTNIEQDTVDIHVYYSDFLHARVGLEETIALGLWNDNWFKLDTEGKKNIIKEKLRKQDKRND